MDVKYARNFRTLDLYVRLCEGRLISKSEEAQRFGVDERTIQRDIDDIRAFLGDYAVEHGQQGRKDIQYDRAEKGFKLIGNEDAVMSNGEILAVSKILLESRAFSKKEIASILEKLINGCASSASKKLVNEAVCNEKYHYVELQSKSYSKEKLWDLNEEIQSNNLLEIIYGKAVASKETVHRIIEPVAILFSEYYFYLNAYIVELNEQGTYEHKYDYPAIFRMDRIKSYKEIGQKFKTPYASRFEEGEYRKRIQFMYAGNIHKCRFRYTGRNKEAVLDRLPTAELILEEENGCVFEVETYGRGIMMWLLSQGTNVEVLWPESFRQRIRQELQDMLKKYEEIKQEEP